MLIVLLLLLCLLFDYFYYFYCLIIVIVLNIVIMREGVQPRLVLLSVLGSLLQNLVEVEGIYLA